LGWYARSGAAAVSPALSSTGAAAGRRLPSLLLAAVLPGALPATEPAVAETLRLRGVEYLGDLPTYAAHERGLFAHHGLEVELALERSGRENLRALQAGEADFILTDATTLVIERLSARAPAAPADPVILANLAHASGLHELVTLAGSGLAEAPSLAGRRLGLERGSGAEFLWWQLALYHRLDPAAAVLVDRPIAALPAALAAGRLDAAVLHQPWIARLAAETGEPPRPLSGDYLFNAKWLLVTRRATAREQPERCRRLLAAYQDAIAFIERRPQRVLEHYAAANGLEAASLEAHRAQMLFTLELDWSLIASLQQRIEWARRRGYAPAGAEPALMSWLAPGPLRALAPAAVGIPAAGEAGP